MPAVTEPATSALALNLQTAINDAAKLGKEGVEVLERLHAIAKDERDFHARGAFAVAMSELKAELPPVVKSVAGQHGASRAGTRTKGMYAPLDTICAVLDPLTAKHGFSYRFDREMKDGKEWVLCHVTHRGGHVETTRYPAMDDEPGKGKSPLHARGSGDTYARRYVLTAAFAIVTADPDDDGAAFNRGGDDIADPTPPSEADAGAVANLRTLLDESPDRDEETRLLEWMSTGAGRRIERLSDLGPRQLSAAIKAVSDKRARGWK